MFNVGNFAGTKKPSFASTLSGFEHFTNGATVSEALPTATGGDLGHGDTSVFGYAYSATGLPPGLEVDGDTGTLSGTPTTDGFYTVTYRAEDADANLDDADAAIQKFKILISSTAGSTRPSFASTRNILLVESGEAVSQVLSEATGGDHPGSGYAYSVSGLPPGLSFDPFTRTISGTQSQTGSWSVTYKAHDADSSTTDADAAIDTFTIWVSQTETPLSTTAPSFSELTASFSIDENNPSGATVGTVAASDGDGDSLTYSLTSDGDDHGSFSIDAAGSITVASGITLDYETKASYTVTAQVTDGEDSGGNQESTATIDDTIPVAITVTNVKEPPGEPTAVGTGSPTPGSFRVFWTAPSGGGAPPVTDYDVRYFAGATDPGSEADWIEAGESGGHDHKGTGTHATIAGLLADTAYRVQVRAVGDGAGPWSASADGKTALPSQTPTLPQFVDGATASLSIAENHADGAVVGTVAAADDDADDLTFSLASGGDNDSFTIDAAGSIAVAPGITLDHETKASYTVTARVTDGEDSGGNQESTATIDDMITVTITVTDVAEPPGAPTGVTVTGATATTLTVSWNAPSDRGAQAITDYDVRYAAGTADPASVADWIGVGDRGGHDHVGTARTTEIPGLDPGTAYRVQVRAVGDGAGPWSASGEGSTAAASLAATVPRFVDDAAASFSIARNHPDSAVVGRVAAADDDADELTYSLAAGGDNESFTIDEDGVIQVKTGVRLNPAAQASYTVMVQVTDGEDAAGNPEATPTIDATITVTITVTNPGAPAGVRVTGATAASLTVSWNAPSESLVGPITDYDVRYVAGAADPASEEDWIEADESGGHDHVGTATSATIAGLAAGTAYRVQVRAVGDDDAGPWSESAAGTTSARAAAADAERTQVLQHALATVATRTLASTLDQVGARFARAAPAPGAVAAAGPDLAPAAAGGVLVQPRSAQRQAVELSEVLRVSAFDVPLGAGTDGAVRWAVWGRGGLGDFAGRVAPDASYEGSTLGGWLGADVRLGAWLGGLAISRMGTTAEYALTEGATPAERGELQTTLTAIYPYASVSFLDRFEVQALGGAGLGEARHYPGGEAAKESSDLWMVMGSVGLRGRIVSESWLDLTARADGGYARLWTADGNQAIDRMLADGWRGRLGLEVAPRLALGDSAALVPFAEVAGRQDGGDGLTGTGLELAGGLRLSTGLLHVEARGRMLAVHTAEEARERGVTLTARLSPQPDGSGLSLAVAPRIGVAAGAADALWAEALPRPAAAAGAEAAALDARIGYGATLPGGDGLLTPFAEAGLGEGASRVRIGTRLEASRPHLGAEFAGERRQRGAARPEHTVSIDLNLRY
ncbi:MAG: fibronectin type III domain-containing protein [Spirochaetaceae bacterium]|nr:fibronectin type III domain-containing protein [Spirochaetaceae bacterium]